MENTVPPTLPDGNDKLFAVLCHLSTFLGVALILPLIVYLVKKSDSGFVADQAGEALNFHLSLLIYGVVGMVLTMVVIGVFMLIALGLATVVLSIVAAVKAASGENYRYPFTIRFVN